MAQSQALRQPLVTPEHNVSPAHDSARDGEPWFFLTFGPASMALTVVLISWLSKLSF